MQITCNYDMGELSQELFLNKILELFQMNDSHPRFVTFDPNTRLMNEDLVLDAEEHCLYQSTIES
jgi:hypothetical protein